MFVRHIPRFTNIRFQIVQLQLFKLALLIFSGQAVSSTRLAAKRTVSVRKLQLPPPISTGDRLKLTDLVVSIVAVVGIPGAALAGDDWPDVQAVDLVFRNLGADKFG